MVCNDHIRIYIRQADKYIYLQDGKQKDTDGKVGLVAHCLQSESMVTVQKPCIDPHYNQLVDIITELPLIAVPIRPIEGETLLGVIQFVDIRHLARNYLE